MSQWVALNVAYEDDVDSDDIDTFLSRVSAYDHPNDGFDVLLTVFTSHLNTDRRSAVIHRLRDMAAGAGNPECEVSIRGGDTSDVFTAKLHGDESSEWSNTYGEGWGIQHNSGQMLDDIEADIGRRPDLGGNYTSVHGRGDNS